MRHLWKLPERWSGRRTEAGTAIVEFIWLAILLLIPLLYIMVAVFDAQRTAYAATTAAQAATRAFVAAPDAHTAFARAELAAQVAFADQGVDAGYTLQVQCLPGPRACLQPGSLVHVEVAARAVLPLVPPVFGSQPPAITVAAEHQSVYGEFRQGRP